MPLPSHDVMQFSLRCVKYDRHGYKARNRVFIVTDKGCHIVDVGNFKLKESFTFDEIQSILVSNLTDGIIVIRLPSEGPKARGDLILQTDQVIELVLKLGLYGNKLQQVEIFTTNTYVCQIKLMIIRTSSKFAISTSRMCTCICTVDCRLVIQLHEQTCIVTQP